jgi:hypothetical protein
VIAAALLMLAALAHLAPDVLAAVGGGSVRAWEYVAGGAELACLYAAVGFFLRHWTVTPVAAWGAAEGLQRAGCRLAFPMDRAPQLAEGQTLCTAATGMPTGWVGLAVAVLVAGVVWKASNGSRKNGG